MPEVALRRAMHALGLRFRLHRQLAKGCTPDILVVRHQVAIFVDGCFWHCCPEHGRTSFSGPNARLWEAKMQRNKARDERSTLLAKDQGFEVLRLWECQIRSDANCVAEEVRRACLGVAPPRQAP